MNDPQASQLMSELEQCRREFEEFAYIVSHDLQEPLRAISEFSQYLEEDYADRLDEQAHQYLGFIVGGAQHMQALLDGLLEYSRAGRIEADPRPVNLHQIAEAALAQFDQQIATSGAQIQIGPLPTVTGNSQWLMRLFENLIENAIKFHRPEATPHVSITAEVQENVCRVSIQDDGIGFEPKDQQRIFQIFQRLHVRSAYPGAGAGLAVCRRIVQAHSGEISAASTPGQGSTFTIILPNPQPSPDGTASAD